MNRREFIAGTTAAAALVAAPATARSSQSHFKLKYAPHFGMFRHHAGDDPLDQLQFMADEGFTALEDNGMRRRPKDLQERIARTMERLGLEMGVFVAHADFGQVTFASDKEEIRDRLLDEIRCITAR